MPFRLDQIPFFNTSMMCEPADPTFFTTFEEEHEPWDAPLRRRNNTSSHISNRLYQNHRRESHHVDFNGDDGVLIMEPFSRDPTMPLKRIQPRKYSSPRPSVSNYMEDSHNTLVSPTPYSPPNFGAIKSKFNDINGKTTDSKVFKKRAAPSPPKDFGNDVRTPSKKGPAPQPYQKADPLLKEMQSFGQNKVIFCMKIGLTKLNLSNIRSMPRKTTIHLRSTSSLC